MPYVWLVRQAQHFGGTSCLHLEVTQGHIAEMETLMKVVQYWESYCWTLLGGSRFLENLCTLVRGDTGMPVTKHNNPICQGICMCVYVCMYVYMYVYTHTHTHTQREGASWGMGQTLGECSLG
jgi:hypothetical protein